MNKVSSFCLLLSENCNFACKYCYEKVGNGHNSKNMSIKVAEDALNWIFASDVSGDSVNISLFGGEPTLNPDVIELVFNRGKELAKIHNKKFTVGMITNGSLMSERVYNIFSSNIGMVTNLQLSIDGNKSTQDMNRVLLNGGGSFDMVEKFIPYWKAITPELNIHGVVNADTVHNLYDNYIFFKEEWGVDRLWFMPAKDERYTQEHVDIYDEQMGKIREYVMKELHRTKDFMTLRKVAPFGHALNDGPMSKPCGIGDNYISITAEGGIWPCHHMYFVDTDDSTKLGDIYTGIDASKQRIWQEYDATDMVGCEGCDHGNCYRCPAENFEKNGSPFVQITGMHCDFMKVDLKHQRLIIKELEDMGLRGDKKSCGDGGCEGCDDKGFTPFDQVVGGTAVEAKPIDTPVVDQVSDNPNENLKNLIDDMMHVLAKWHNKL